MTMTGLDLAVESCRRSAGLLTFLSLLFLPDLLVSGVIQADLLNEDYSCRYSSGLSPDSLASGGISHRIA